MSYELSKYWVIGDQTGVILHLAFQVQSYVTPTPWLYSNAHPFR
jgi:hypothetical protein